MSPPSARPDSPAAPALAASLLRVWDDFPEAIVALDPEWRYQYLNGSALRMLQLTPDVVGRDSRDVHPEASGSAFGAAYLRVMSSRVMETVERHYQPLDTYLNALVAPWPDSGIVIVLRDVTEERRPQARLQRNHDLYQQLLDQTTQALTLRDLEGRFLLVNRAAAARLGSPAEELLGRLSSEVLSPEIERSVRDADRMVRETGEPQDNPAAQLLSTDRNVVSQVFPVRDDDDVLIGLGTLVADVTELTEAQAGLAASQRRFRRVFASTSLGIVVTREDGEIVEVNSALCRLLGYSRDALLDMNGMDLVPPGSDQVKQRRRRRALRDGADGYEMEDEFVRSDGQVVPVLMTINVLDDPAGRGRLISCVVRDLTSLHQLQAQVVSAERMKAVGRLAAGIAHDSNNILAAVSGYAELLAEEVAELPAARRHVDGIVRSVERACDMVAGLLAFTRGQPMAPALVDLSELVRDLADMLRQLLPAGVELELDLQPVPARVDASQIRQVVLNLVVNARDAVDGAGTIRVSTRLADDAVVLAVADDGPGMTPEVARRCLEPFFTTRAASGGSGVGLSTAHGIARQSGGELRVTTAVGGGTTFELVLPAAEAAALSRPALVHQDVTVLVADDDPEVRNLMRSTLVAAGYQVRVAENGVEALAAAGGVDLVVTDLDMPLMAGQELAERLATRSPAVPVLLVSGTGSPPLDGGLPFLAKPFTRDAFLRTVQAVLAAAP